MSTLVSDVLKEIKTGLDQTSSSKKDEIRVMQAMLNDKTYVVGVYGKEGKVGEYSPYEDSRDMISSVISATTKVSKEEATKLAENHEFSKQEAGTFINVGKEFINTYMHTGRKLPLGCREKSNVALSLKEIPASEKSFPKKVGVDSDGKAIYEHPTIKTKGYESIKVYGSCPAHLK